MVSRTIFQIFTSDGISDGISDVFQIFGLEIKKKKYEVGSMGPPGITLYLIDMLLLTCQSQYLVLYSFSGCRAHSRAGPIGV